MAGHEPSSIAKETTPRPTGPISGTFMPEAYARLIARFAYVWAWPMVNLHNRRAAMYQVPAPGLIGGIVPAAPVNQICMLTAYVDPMERIVATPNQDVIYGFGMLSLDLEPVVVQVPDFGDRFWVYQAVDQRTDCFVKLGAMYDTAPGLYLLAGPDWQGTPPPGIQGVFHSPTPTGALIPRIFVDDTDADFEAVQPLVRQVAAYPLSSFDGAMRTVDWANVPRFPSAGDGQGEVQWVSPDAFFDILPTVLDEVPPLPGEEALYEQFRALLEAATSDPERIMTVLREVAAETEHDLIAGLFDWQHQGIPLPNGWTTMLNAAQWGTDYLTRASAAKANIFSNAPLETVYFALDLDAEGQRLHGGNRYAMTFGAGQLPPVRGFWSLTMYNAHHFFEPNTIGRYSIGTKNRDLQPAADGSLTITVASTPPTTPAERANWLPAPDGDFSLYLRAYWPEAAIVERDWTPPPVRIVDRW